MNGVYLLTYDGVIPSREVFIAWLDRQQNILNWQATTIPQLYVLVWAGSGLELRDQLHFSAGLENFICVAVNPEDLGSKLNGWTAAATIDFIRKAVGAEELVQA